MMDRLISYSITMALAVCTAIALSCIVKSISANDPVIAVIATASFFICGAGSVLSATALARSKGSRK